MAKDYTARILDERSKKASFDELDYTPIAIPAGSVLPETTQQTMARLMLNSGLISRDDFHKMIGVTFDGDFGVEQEDFSDDSGFSGFSERFQQSPFAQYEDDRSFDERGIRLETPAPSVGENPRASADQNSGHAPDSSAAGQSVGKNEPQGSGSAHDPQTQSADARGGHQ